MIYRLEIENFYSVKERQVIDLVVNRKVSEEPGRLVPTYTSSPDRAPRVVALFGANASGKSNVLRAISFVAWFVRYSFQHQANTALPYQKFSTNAMIGASTRISLAFSGPENPLGSEESPTCPYAYTLVLSPRDGEADRVERESLYYRPRGSARFTRIFDRGADGRVKTAGNTGMGRELPVLEKILRPDASAISTLAQLNNALALNYIEIARTIYTNILITRFEQDEFSLLNGYARDPFLLESLNRDIRRIDLGIDDVRIIARNGAPVATFSHSGLDHPVEMALESHGTQQFVRIYPILHDALTTGGAAIVDELDGAIHPAVLPEILRWFADPARNSLGAQLWMSCHSVSLLDELIKEEVVICDKSIEGATQVYGLSDVQGIRRNENFVQNYLGGAYGGVPIIG